MLRIKMCVLSFAGTLLLLQPALVQCRSSPASAAHRSLSAEVGVITSWNESTTSRFLTTAKLSPALVASLAAANVTGEQLLSLSLADLVESMNVTKADAKAYLKVVSELVDEHDDAALHLRNLLEIRAFNRGHFDVLFVTALFNPFAAVAIVHAVDQDGFDDLLLGEDAESPFSWPAFLLAPGWIVFKYLWPFYDTNSVLVAFSVQALGIKFLANWVLVVVLYYFNAEYKRFDAEFAALLARSRTAGVHIAGKHLLQAQSFFGVPTLYVRFLAGEYIVWPLASAAIAVALRYTIFPILPAAMCDFLFAAIIAAAPIVTFASGVAFSAFAYSQVRDIKFNRLVLRRQLAAAASAALRGQERAREEDARAERSRGRVAQDDDDGDVDAEDFDDEGGGPDENEGEGEGGGEEGEEEDDEEEGGGAEHHVTQCFEFVDSEADKASRIMRVMEKIMDGSRIIIFCETKRGADDLCRNLRRDGYPALAIHGDKEQRERDWVLAEFKAGKVPIMIATDVASRGLDIKDIKYVVNYDMPKEIVDYVHRIGRTGRKTSEGYNEGTAISFFGSNNSRLARPLLEILREANQVIPPKMEEYASSGGAAPRVPAPAAAQSRAAPSSEPARPPTAAAGQVASEEKEEDDEDEGAEEEEEEEAETM